ncbi:MAG: PstS family phosphate ABC transporter substrate-binding protein, partial [Nitrospiraceae bacterium]
VEPGIASYRPAADVSGNIVIAGSDTMQPLMARLATEFRQWYPDTKIAVQGGGTESALMQFLSDQATIRRGDAFYKGHQVSGSVSLLASSRELSHQESDEFQSRYGYQPTKVPIAMDAVAIYVNRANPIPGLTLPQVDAIFGTTRKRGLQEDIRTWGQVGLRDDWESQPVHLYGRDKKSGTRSFFKHEALLDGEFRAEVTEEVGSASEILALSRDVLGIGYAGIGFQASTVRVVPLAEKAEMPYVHPTAESAANGTYPLGRPLYLYVKKDPKADLAPVILEFLKFINSHEGQQAAVKAGLYPLSRTQVAESLHTLTGSAGATTSATALSH